MIVIDNIIVSATELISSNAAEPSGGDPAAWAAGTAYSVDDLAYRASTHRIYRRLVAGTTAAPPETDIEGVPGVTAPNWEDYLPTNRWACFDQEVNTQTVLASGPLAITVAPGVIVSGLALLEMVGDEVTITMTDGAVGPTVYSRTVNLITSLVTDWYQYFFEPFSQQGTLVLLDLPPYLNGRVTVSIDGPGEVRLGCLAVGTVYPLAAASYGARAGVLNNSKTEENLSTGVVKFKKGKRRRTMRLDLQVPNGAINKIDDVLSRVDSRAVVWVGMEDSEDFAPFTVLGFARDFSLVVPYPSHSIYSLDIEGMT